QGVQVTFAPDEASAGPVFAFDNDDDDDDQGAGETPFFLDAGPATPDRSGSGSGTFASAGDGPSFAGDTSVVVGGGLLEYGDQLVEIPRAVKALHMSYAKKQKQVDIKRLKQSLWTKIGDAPTREPKKFSDAIGMLDPKSEKIGEVSVAYCFICLLHLANERNLSIAGNQNLDDLTVIQID
ncbi:hypothetical protein HK405_009894, partial [Cladochytrium tenue]